MMDPIRVLLTLAGSEATAAGYAEITPAHLLMALSRASESDLEPQLDTTRLQGETDRLTPPSGISALLYPIFPRSGKAGRRSGDG